MLKQTICLLSGSMLVTNTGNTTSPWLYVSITCFALALMLVFFGIKNRKRRK